MDSRLQFFRMLQELRVRKGRLYKSMLVAIYSQYLSQIRQVFRAFRKNAARRKLVYSQYLNSIKICTALRNKARVVNLQRALCTWKQMLLTSKVNKANEFRRNRLVGASFGALIRYCEECREVSAAAEALTGPFARKRSLSIYWTRWKAKMETACLAKQHMRLGKYYELFVLLAKGLAQLRNNVIVNLGQRTLQQKLCRLVADHTFLFNCQYVNCKRSFARWFQYSHREAGLKSIVIRGKAAELTQGLVRWKVVIGAMKETDARMKTSRSHHAQYCMTTAIGTWSRWLRWRNRCQVQSKEADQKLQIINRQRNSQCQNACPMSIVSRRHHRSALRRWFGLLALHTTERHLVEKSMQLWVKVRTQQALSKIQQVTCKWRSIRLQKWRCRLRNNRRRLHQAMLKLVLVLKQRFANSCKEKVIRRHLRCSYFIRRLGCGFDGLLWHMNWKRETRSFSKHCRKRNELYQYAKTINIWKQQLATLRMQKISLLRANFYLYCVKLATFYRMLEIFSYSNRRQHKNLLHGIMFWKVIRYQRVMRKLRNNVLYRQRRRRRVSEAHSTYRRNLILDGCRALFTVACSRIANQQNDNKIQSLVARIARKWLHKVRSKKAVTTHRQSVASNNVLNSEIGFLVLGQSQAVGSNRLGRYPLTSAAPRVPSFMIGAVPKSFLSEQSFHPKPFNSNFDQTMTSLDNNSESGSRIGPESRSDSGPGARKLDDMQQQLTSNSTLRDSNLVQAAPRRLQDLQARVDSLVPRQDGASTMSDSSPNLAQGGNIAHPVDQSPNRIADLPALQESASFIPMGSPNVDMKHRVGREILAFLAELASSGVVLE